MRPLKVGTNARRRHGQSMNDWIIIFEESSLNKHVNDVIPEESVLEKSDEESEAHVTKTFLAGWRAKQKNAGTRKGREFQGNLSVPWGSKAPFVAKLARRRCL